MKIERDHPKILIADTIHLTFLLPENAGNVSGTMFSGVAEVMMVVKVKVFADLRQYIPELGLGESLAVKVESGVTIRQLFEQLEIPESEIKLAFVNGISREFEDILSDGDEVSFFSPVGGG